MMKKFFNICFYLCLFVCLTFVTTKVSAKSIFYVEEPNVEYSDFLLTGKWVEKKTWSNQEIFVDQAKTSMTDPCPKCQFIVRTRTDIGSEGALGDVIKLYESRAFIGHDGSSKPGNFKLKIMRADFTLLKTLFGAIWTYDL